MPRHPKRNRTSFAPGNTGGPGRPTAQREAQYYTIVIKGCSPARWRKIVARAVQDAEAGDRHARAWLADRIMGRAKETVDMAVTQSPPDEFRLAGRTDEEMDAEGIERLFTILETRHPGLIARTLRKMEEQADA